MPAWVVILLFAGALIFGYIGIAGLDIKQVSPTEESIPPMKSETLLFGPKEDIFSAREWLKKSKYCYDEIDAPELPREGHYQLLLALSKSDVDNLILCAAAKKQYDGIKTAARLTDTVYLPVFRDAGIDYILPNPGNTEIMELLNHVHPHA